MAIDKSLIVDGDSGARPSDLLKQRVKEARDSRDGKTKKAPGGKERHNQQVERAIRATKIPLTKSGVPSRRGLRAYCPECSALFSTGHLLRHRQEKHGYVVPKRNQNIGLVTVRLTETTKIVVVCPECGILSDRTGTARISLHRLQEHGVVPVKGRQQGYEYRRVPRYPDLADSE